MCYCKNIIPYIWIMYVCMYVSMHVIYCMKRFRCLLCYLIQYGWWHINTTIPSFMYLCLPCIWTHFMVADVFLFAFMYEYTKNVCMYAWSSCVHVVGKFLSHYFIHMYIGGRYFICSRKWGCGCHWADIVKETRFN